MEIALFHTSFACVYACRQPFSLMLTLVHYHRQPQSQSEWMVLFVHCRQKVRKDIEGYSNRGEGRSREQGGKVC